VSVNDSKFIAVHPFRFIAHWRSLPTYEMISYLLMYASVPMLAYGIRPYDSSMIVIIILTILSLYSGFFAALIWNDITDVDIDNISHPDRPIPSGMISSKKFFVIAVFFSILTFVFSYLVSFWCLVVVGLSALFVTFHNKYLKKIVRIPAYSEIFTPLQWIVVPVFGYIAIEGSNLQNMVLLVIFTYFADAAHDLPEGIHDLEGDRASKVGTYATSFGVSNAARISFIMFLVSGILGIFLYYRTILSAIFLFPFICVWGYTLFYSIKLLKANKNEINNLSAMVGRKGFNYFLFSFDLIFIDLIIQLIWFNYM
jgi:geranylgeranylglycerol-phosphate geranylgeranyltransferase